MKKERQEYEKTVARIRVQKALTVAVFFVVAVLTVMFVGGFHYYNGIEEKGFGLSLHPLIVLCVVIVEGIVAVVFYSRTENQMEKILDDDCDPLTYFKVRKAFLSHKNYEATMPIIELCVSYYLGDFAKCQKIAERVSNNSGVHDKLYALYFLGVSSYHLKESKTLDKALRDFKRLIERGGLKLRSPIRKEMDRKQRILEMLSFACRNDKENAISFANSLYLDDGAVSNIELLNTEYLRGAVYKSFNESRKAEECFKRCRGIPNETFIEELTAAPQQ